MVDWARLSSNIERSISSEVSYERAMEIAGHHGFSVCFERTSGDIVTTTCNIFDKNKKSAVGRGKGLGAQSDASALFEAFEHFYYRYENYQTKIVSNSIEFDWELSDIKYSSPDFQKILKSKNAPLSCFRYKSVIDDADYIDYPSDFI